MSLTNMPSSLTHSDHVKSKEAYFRLVFPGLGQGELGTSFGTAMANDTKGTDS